MNRVLYSTTLISFFYLVLACLRVGAQEVHSFSLQQSIDYALQHQGQVAMALIDEQVTRERNKEVSGLALPQVSATGQFQDFLNIPTTLIPKKFFDPNAGPNEKAAVRFGTKYNASGTISLNQVLFDGSVLTALQARRTIEELARKNVHRTEQEVRVAVTKAYYNVLIGKKRMELLNSNLMRLQQLLHDTKETYRNGFAEKLDVDRVTVQLNNTRTEKNKLESALLLGEQLLKFQMGMPLKMQLQLTDTLGFDEVSRNLLAHSLDSFDYSNRIEYSLLNTQRKVNEYDLQRYRLAYLPSLSAFGSYGVNAARDEFNFFRSGEPWFKTSIVGLSLSIPIFDGLQRQRRVEQARLNLLKTQRQMEYLQQSIDLEQQQAFTTLRNSLLAMEAQKENMALAEQVYNTTKKKYEQGVGTNIEIINAESALKEAQTNYFSALYDAMVAKVDYLKAIGKL